MGTITGSLTIELAWNKQKKLGVSCMCTKNYEHNPRNNKKIVRK